MSLDYNDDTVGSPLYQHWMLYPIPMPLRWWCKTSLAGVALTAAVKAAQARKTHTNKLSSTETSLQHCLTQLQAELPQ